jgi:hypothetical protein
MSRLRFSSSSSREGRTGVLPRSTGRDVFRLLIIIRHKHKRSIMNVSSAMSTICKSDTKTNTHGSDNYLGAVYALMGMKMSSYTVDDADAVAAVAAVAQDTGKEFTFSLYDACDEGLVNDAHTIFRRDVWEGFVVPNGYKGARRDYEGTVALRCCFCKHLPLEEREKHSELFPRSLKTIYRSYLQFNSDHFQTCKFIPHELKAKHNRLKKTKGINRGRKNYWETSAARKGMMNTPRGIMFCSDIRDDVDVDVVPPSPTRSSMLPPKKLWLVRAN